jgi:hypothetical protein
MIDHGFHPTTLGLVGTRFDLVPGTAYLVHPTPPDWGLRLLGASVPRPTVSESRTLSINSIAWHFRNRDPSVVPDLSGWNW